MLNARDYRSFACADTRPSADKREQKIRPCLETSLSNFNFSSGYTFFFGQISARFDLETLSIV